HRFLQLGEGVRRRRAPRREVPRPREVGGERAVLRITVRRELQELNRARGLAAREEVPALAMLSLGIEDVRADLEAPRGGRGGGRLLGRARLVRPAVEEPCVGPGRGEEEGRRLVRVLALERPRGPIARSLQERRADRRLAGARGKRQERGSVRAEKALVCG